MKYRKARSTFIGAALGTLPAFGALARRVDAAQFEVKCSWGLAADHPISVSLTQMWAAIEQESGGRMHAQLFPNGTLANDTAALTQLRVGALQFGLINSANLADVAPAAGISYIGFAFKDTDEGVRVMQGALGDYLRREIASKGVQPAHAFWGGGMVHICSGTHPIRTPDDLHGFKIRVVPSPISVELFKQLGASPTPVEFPAAYTALQTKLVDGGAASLVVFETSHWYEVQKYVSLTNHQGSGLWLLSNPDYWKSLPADIQDIVERNNTKFAASELVRSKAADAAAADYLRGHGLTLNTVDQGPFRTLLRPYYQYWANTFGATEWGLFQDALGRRLV